MTNKDCFQSQSLSDWLFYMESNHPTEIDLGLSRVQQVGEQANILDLNAKNTILVAGTNGKGTTIAFLEHYLMSLGFTVAVFSSPHLFSYNERLRINGQELTDEHHISALSHIEQHRGETSLSYFEFSTLACLELIKREQVDFALVEVGLGGRLDATNIINHDMAVITSIGIDHTDFLGDTKEKIAFEKAGIFRANKPAIVGEPKKFDSFLQQAKTHSVSPYLQANQDYFIERLDNGRWVYKSIDCDLTLNDTLIPKQNIATAITCLTQLAVEVDENKINTVLSEIQVAGRMQCLSTKPLQYVDVAHNNDSVAYLISLLQNSTQFSQITGISVVIAMMKDKDVTEVIKLLSPLVNHWYIGDLCGNSRALSADELRKVITNYSDKPVSQYSTIKQAWQGAQTQQQASELLLGLGSFFTVADILSLAEG